MDATYLFFTEVLAIVRARGSTDVVQGLLESSRVALRQSNADTEHCVRRGRADERVPSRSAVPALMHAHVASQGLAQSEREERGDEEGSGDHLAWVRTRGQVRGRNTFTTEPKSQSILYRRRHHSFRIDHTNEAQGFAIRNGRVMLCIGAPTHTTPVC